MGQELFPGSSTGKVLLGAQIQPAETLVWKSPKSRELTVHCEFCISDSPQTGFAIETKRGSRPAPSWVAAAACSWPPSC